MSYKCEFCESVYRYKQKLVSHLKIEHSLKMNKHVNDVVYHGKRSNASDALEKGYDDFVKELMAKRDAWRSAEVNLDKIEQLTIQEIKDSKFLNNDDNILSLDDLVSAEVKECETANATKVVKCSNKIKEIKPLMDAEELKKFQENMDVFDKNLNIKEAKRLCLVYDLYKSLNEKDIGFRLNDRLHIDRYVLKMYRSNADMVQK